MLQETDCGFLGNLIEAIQEFFMSLTTENNKKKALVGKQQ
jgi:hypothetical protein